MPLLVDGYEVALPDEVVDALNDQILSNVDPALDLQPEEPLGQITGIIGAALSELDQAILSVYRSFFIDSAEGESLEALAALTGVYRLQPEPSTVTLTLGGSNGTVIAAGKTVSSPSTGRKWVTTTGGTISGGTLEVEAASETAGAIAANAATITQIDTPVVGWTTVTNTGAADLGRLLETDAELRARQRSLLFAAGNGTAQAIRDAILRVPGVDSATVFENDTNAVDADGVPAHAFEALVIGGDDEDIARAIFDTKPAGIQAFGDVVETVTDDQGFSTTIGFSRPDEAVVFSTITVSVNEDYAGDAAVKQAMIDYVDGLEVGRDVIRNKLIQAVLGVAGVEDVTALQIALLGDTLGTANLVIGNRELATLESVDIAVTTNPYVDGP